MKYIIHKDLILENAFTRHVQKYAMPYAFGGILGGSGLYSYLNPQEPHIDSNVDTSGQYDNRAPIHKIYDSAMDKTNEVKDQVINKAEAARDQVMTKANEVKDQVITKVNEVKDQVMNEPKQKVPQTEEEYMKEHQAPQVAQIVPTPPPVSHAPQAPQFDPLTGNIIQSPDYNKQSLESQKVARTLIGLGVGGALLYGLDQGVQHRREIVGGVKDRLRDMNNITKMNTRDITGSVKDRLRDVNNITKIHMRDIARNIKNRYNANFKSSKK